MVLKRSGNYVDIIIVSKLNELLKLYAAGHILIISIQKYILVIKLEIKTTMFRCIIDMLIIIEICLLNNNEIQNQRENFIIPILINEHFGYSITFGSDHVTAEQSLKSKNVNKQFLLNACFHTEQLTS